MDSSSTQSYHEEMGSQTLESMLVCVKTQQEKKPRPAETQAQKCPRCDSPNTKFCYYNNYSLSQPRYFCKSCRRYWTKGGTLRNVPVGGGCRKNRRSSSSSSSSSSSKRGQDQPLVTLPIPIPSLDPLPYDSNDISLAIAKLQSQYSGHLGLDGTGFSIWGNLNMPHFGMNGFLETPNSGVQNLYYGVGNGSLEMETGMGMNGRQETGRIPFDDFSGGGGGPSMAVTAVKQEMCSSGREGEGRVFWGFPCQNGGGDGHGAVSEFDSSRLNWIGIGSSSWHGLLNSPLM